MLVMRRVVLAATAAMCLSLPAWAQSPPSRLRGTIESVSAQTLALTMRGGEKVSVAMTADTPVLEVLPAQMSDIKPGSFIGTAAMPQKDGTQMAMEVVVFPEAMRGAGEGHYPWDLQPESTMTNGTVSGDVTGNSGRMLTVTYKGGEKQISVPTEAPIVTFAPGSHAMLVPGAHVLVFASKSADGALTALRVAVGKDGLTPPM